VIARDLPALASLGIVVAAVIAVASATTVGADERYRIRHETA